MEFTFGPRHRVITRTVRGVWLRAFASVVVGIVLGVMLLAALGILAPTRAHAGLNQTAELKAAAERLNSTCRDDPKAAGACMARDGLLAQLRNQGHCWNAKAPTPATLWQPCRTASLPRLGDVCERGADIAFTLALYRDTEIAPQIAYRKAVDMAAGYGLDAGPLQAMTWAVYVDLGAKSPDAVRRLSRLECRRARGVL